MNINDREHLLDEHVLWAVIDEKELSGQVLEHLNHCPVCSARVTQMKDDLREFGRKASQAVPPYSRPVKLPVAKPVPVRQGPGWLPFFGAVAMAGLVVFIHFMSLDTRTAALYVPVQNQQTMIEDETLMQEITDMVEYPFPGDIYDITGDDDDGLDDDFMDFVVPEAQDDSQSQLLIKGGLNQC